MAKARSGSVSRPGQLRIIGGRFRGRLLTIPDGPGLRPTGDRIRETLFNWLAPRIAGSRCLDCFAGAGGLGFEAASRGAARVVMIEQSAAASRQLAAGARTLGADRVEVIEADALRWLASQPPATFDIVFLDPPFATGLLTTAGELLQRRGWVAPGSVVYLEAPLHEGFPPLPAGWEFIRDKSAGQVRFGLVSVEGAV